jgi:hypothetical protein
MHKGVALAILAPAGNDDYESVQMSTNPKFIALLERSRKSYREEGGIPAEEVRKMFADEKDGEINPEEMQPPYGVAAVIVEADGIVGKRLLAVTV